MKKPTLLTILIRFYSFQWLGALLRCLGYIRFQIYIPKIKFKQKSPLPPLKSASMETGEKYQSETGPVKVTKTYFVYILRSLSDKKFYIGTTDDIYACLERHNAGKNISTFDKRPFQLIYYEPFLNYFDAKNREGYLKSKAGQIFLKKHLRNYFASAKSKKSTGILKVASLVSAVVLALLVPSIIARILTPQETSIAAWFNESWLYRKSLTFTHNASLTNRQVQFSIATSTLISNGQMQSDCGDSRFTDNNGNLLAYYLVSGCNSGATLYNVYIPVINNGTTVIYHYYGNPSAPNGTATNPLPFTSLSPSGGAATAGSEEQSPGPVSYWKFDEGTGTTSYDSTQSKNDGSLGATTAAPTWKNEDFCISQKCLYFDGTNDYIEKTSASNLPLGSSPRTVEAWAKIDGSIAYQYILAYGTQTNKNWFGLAVQDTGQLYIDTWANDTPGTTKTISFNTWHHIAATYDGNTTVNFYVDGKFFETNSIPAQANTTGTTLRIGSSTSNDYFLQGFLDEVKIYSNVRTNAQIQTDYSSRGSSKGVAVQIGQSDTGFLNNGLVGYWNMDETTAWATNCTTASVLDLSGNGYNGKPCPNASAVTQGTGKFGSAGVFDGINDYIDLPAASFDPTNSFTVSAWIKPTDFSQNNVLLGISTGNSFYIFTDTANLNVYGGSLYASSTNVLQSGQWQHVVITHPTSTTYRFYVNGVDVTNVTEGDDPQGITNLHIGRFYSDYFKGSIDDFRIYNRSLSTSEIKKLYKWTPGPVMYLKMDESSWTNDCSTGTVLDSSGNGLNGRSCGNGTGPTKTVIGKIGNAGNFDGVNDYVSVADNSLLKPTGGMTASFWVYPRNTTSFSYFYHKEVTPNGYGFYFDTGGILHPYIRVSGVWSDITGPTIPANQWYYITQTFDGSSQKLYVNGVLVANQSAVGTIDNSTSSFEISRDDGLSTYANQMIDDFKFYNYARTDSQVIEDMNGGHPVGGSPVGSQLIYLKMDEQNGTTVNNSGFGGTTYTKTLSGPTWLDNTRCKTNGCLNFDTTTDTIDFGDVTFTDGLASMSASIWLNPQNLTTNKWILSKASGTQRTFQFQTDASTATALQVYVSGSLTDTSRYCQTGAGVISTNSWQHFAFVYDGSQTTMGDRIKLYKNGKRITCTVPGTIPSSLLATNANLKLGKGDDTATSLIGFMDEFKLYTSALTEDQVKIDYNQGASINFNTGTGIEASQSAQTNESAPVASYNFDENKDNTCSGGTDDVCDKSGNTFNMANQGVANWTVGKTGSALNFGGGSNDKTTYNDTGVSALDISGSFTIQAWIRPSSLTTDFQSILVKHANSDSTANYSLATGATGLTGRDEIDCAFNDGGSNPSLDSTSVNLTVNKWYFITCVFDTTANTITIYSNGVQTDQSTGVTTDPITGNSDLFIGNDASGLYANPFNGAIDEVKIYNYARTPSQVAYDYNRGGPVGWWKFDECQGSTLYDSSGNGNNGTITIGSTVPNSSIGTCAGTSSQAWFNGVTGKFNRSIDFDGVDDYATFPTSTTLFPSNTSWSVSTWFQADDTTVSQDERIFVARRGATGSAISILLGNDNPDDLIFIYYDNTTFQTLQLALLSNLSSAWHHVVATYNGTTFNAYLDGKLAKSVNDTNFSGFGSGAVVMGQNLDASNNFFNGRVDDARIYNYPLTSAQVQKVFNDGSSVFFGPSTGSP